MTEGAYKDYAFPQKEHWRRTVWNDIRIRIKKLGVNPRNARILYLAGAKNLDAPIMKEKGFTVENAISIERHAATSATLRKGGVLTITATCEEVVRSLPVTQHVNVAMFDLCASLVQSTSMLGHAVLLAPALHEKCAVGFNILRGRETDSGFRETLSDTKQRHARIRLAEWLGAAVPHNHRGLMLFSSVLHDALVDGLLAEAQAESVVRKMRPLFLTYRSGTQLFDSVLWTNGFGALPHQLVKALGVCSDPAVRRSVIANIATITRRLRA